jgi:hypothetical protein
MSSDRLFFKLHNGFPEHPKAFELSDKAFRQLIEAWCYCSRNLNDGKLTKAQFLKLFSAKSRKELLQVGFVKATDFGYEMHDYLEHQQSAEEVENRRNKRIMAGSKGGKAKASTLASAKQMPEQTASKPVADTDTDTDTDTDIEAKASISKERDEFIDWYTAYPRKASRGLAEKAYAKARKKATAEELLAGAERYATDPNREDQFTKLPASWLNADCWEDGPLPSRNGIIQPQRMDHSARARAKEADMLARFNAAQEQPFLEIEG